MGSDTLTITDNRTGKSYVIPVHYGTYPAAGAAIWATDLRQIKVSEDDFGLMSYDPGFMNTAAARSRVTFVDGERGILRYRGYPIEQLAEQSTYLETAYLLLYGELPLREQLNEWTEEIIHHTMLHESIKKFLDGFHYDAHPMGMLIGTLGALSTFYPEARHIHDLVVRRKQTIRLIAKTTELRYTPHPVLERALNVLFILHADHEQNCSTSAMRGIGSAHADPYSALAGAAAALYGPLHGGASGEVLRMLGEIGAPNRVPGYVARVKTGEFKLMGFGHRVYKNYDPRARIIKKVAEEVFGVTGISPLLEIALELERLALADDYFTSRQLYPNVDFYSGIIYQAMGFPVEMFPVLFAIPRTAGWLAQWEEMLQDPEQKISRPRQIYDGDDLREYAPLSRRGAQAA